MARRIDLNPEMQQRIIDAVAAGNTQLDAAIAAGIGQRTLQELAGHSTPVLTARYSHRRLYDLVGAVEKLPCFLPDENTAGVLKATGTDGSVPQDVAPGVAPNPENAAPLDPDLWPASLRHGRTCPRRSAALCWRYSTVRRYS
jgi:hypothetical protein